MNDALFYATIIALVCVFMGHPGYALIIFIIGIMAS
jgi:hypothetical protein